MPAPWYNPQFGQQVLRGLGVKPTPQKMRFMQAWALAEGTQAKNNPFATTRRGYQGESNFNSVGVKNYVDRQQGIKATVDTLQLNYYTHIVSLLRSNDVTAEQLASAVADSPWGTGAGVLRVLGVTQSDGYEKTKSTAQYGATKGKLEQQYQTTILDRFRPSEAYLQGLERMGASGAPALRVASGFQPFTKQTPIPMPQLPADGLGDGGPATSPSPAMLKNGFLQLPTKWKSTHVTDGLADEGYTHAIDLMGAPGTRVGAPESGTVVYYHPTGAQGGGSMLIRTSSGREYWLGHIMSNLKGGSKFKRGQSIARISPDHPRPHVHLDYRGG